MTVYNPDRTALKGWMDLGENTSKGDKYKFLYDMFHGFYDSGAYGSGWASVSLPSTTEDGRWVLRYNTDTATLRLYVMANGSWKYVEFT